MSDILHCLLGRWVDCLAVSLCLGLIILIWFVCGLIFIVDLHYVCLRYFNGCRFMFTCWFVWMLLSFALIGGLLVSLCLLWYLLCVFRYVDFVLVFGWIWMSCCLDCVGCFCCLLGYLSFYLIVCDFMSVLCWLQEWRFVLVLCFCVINSNVYIVLRDCLT